MVKVQEIRDGYINEQRVKFDTIPRLTTKSTSFQLLSSQSQDFQSNFNNEIRHRSSCRHLSRLGRLRRVRAARQLRERVPGLVQPE